MKLTYEQYRMLAQLGPSNDRILLKNKKGQIIKPNVKWDPNPKETRFTSMAMQPRPSPAPMESRSPICLPASSWRPRRPAGKRLLLRYYRDMFARIWFFSPSIKLDPQYAPLRKYLEKMSDQDKEPLMFEDLDQQALGRILNDQRAISEECRKRKQPIPQVCVILDDLADRGDILQKRQGAASGGSWLVTLATRGRHFGVTWIVSSQVLNLVGTVIRKNCRAMCVWRLRNHKEIMTLCEELSGIYDQQTLLEMYRAATAEPYSFLFIRLDAKTRETMFYLRFEQRLVPKDVDEE